MSRDGMCLFWFVSVVFVEYIHGSFDVDEINGINYGIDILDKPVLKGETTLGGSVFLASKFGQQYQCTYAEKTREEELKEKEEEKVAMETGIADLLKPMENNPCLVYTKGWWMYEFCFGKHIRQYHMEDGKITGDISYLGVYSSDYDWSNTTKLRKQRSWLSRYHSQQYVNGTECDLTRKPRRAEVKFFCEQTQGDYISRVDEMETCVYSLSVQTSRICHHPYLKAPSPTRAVPISCNPLLTEAEYKTYTDMLAKEEDKRMRQQIIESESKMSVSYIEKHQNDMFDPEPPAEDVTGLESTNEDEAEAPDRADKLQQVISKSLMEGLKNIFGDEAEDKIKISKMSMKTVKNPGDLDTIIKETLESAKKKRQSEDDLDTTGDGDEGQGQQVESDDDEVAEYDAREDASEAVGAVSESQEEDAALEEGEDLYPAQDEEELKEFEEGLDDYVESEAHLQQIKDYKKTLKQEIHAQFDNILKEAEAELGEIGEGEIDTETAVKTMSDTLSKLMKHLDEKTLSKTKSEDPSKNSQDAAVVDPDEVSDDEEGEDADRATDAGDDGAAVTGNEEAGTAAAAVKDGESDSGLVRMEYDMDYGDSHLPTAPHDPVSRPPHTGHVDSNEDNQASSPPEHADVIPDTGASASADTDGTSQSLRTPETEDAEFKVQTVADGPFKVKIRSRQVRKKDGDNDEERGPEIIQVFPREIPKQQQMVGKTSTVREAKSREHKIQVKIFTSADYYDETTADMLESGSALNKMIVAVLGGNTDEIKEAERQQKMESNYGYVWNKKSKKEQPEATEDTEES